VCFFYVLCYVSRPLIHLFLQMLKHVLPYKFNCIMKSNTFNFLTLKNRPILWRTLYIVGPVSIFWQSGACGGHSGAVLALVSDHPYLVPDTTTHAISHLNLIHFQDTQSNTMYSDRTCKRLRLRTFVRCLYSESDTGEYSATNLPAEEWRRCVSTTVGHVCGRNIVDILQHFTTKHSILKIFLK